MRFDLDAIDSPPGESGAPRSIALQDIDEDPEQPRIEFDDESLRELSATIADRGVKQPVSVRTHPRESGRWMLNFGARRVRAAKLASLTHIPAFVDEAADSYDQVIENEQRKGLKPLELAIFVKKRMAAGESQAEIARRLGKSPTLVTMISAMIDPPDWLLSVYRKGQCKGIAELYELRRLHEREPQRALALVEQGSPITRSTLGAGKLRHATRRTGEVQSDHRPHEASASHAKPEPDLLVRAHEQCDALQAIIERLTLCDPNWREALQRRLTDLVARC